MFRYLRYILSGSLFLKSYLLYIAHEILLVIQSSYESSRQKNLITVKLFWIGTPTWRLWRHVQTLYCIKTFLATEFNYPREFRRIDDFGSSQS